jgi:hypothetical protein
MENLMRPLLLALALLAAGLSATPALAQNRFWLVNQAGVTIEHAYVSPSRLSDWGDDILGGTLVKPGEQVRVTPSAKDCVLDIKVEYAGGQAEEKMEVDACQLDRIVFTNPQGRAEGPSGAVEVATDGPAGRISREVAFAFLEREAAGEVPASPGRAGGRGGERLGLAGLARQPGCALDIRAASESHRPQERRPAAACGRPEPALP